MYLSIQPTPYLFAAFFFLFAIQLSAQDHNCTLSPPDEVTILVSNSSDYAFSWATNDAAVAYEVVVFDAMLGEVLHQEITQAPIADIAVAQFSENTYIGIAAICPNQITGIFGYFLYGAYSTIIVQDIVMQMQGENGPRTLECDVEKTVVQSTSFSGGITNSFYLNPPFNTVGSYQIEGAIIDVILYDQSSGGTFAQATMLGLSNGTVLNAAYQTNVTSIGAVYEFIAPASQNFFDFASPVAGEFEFFVNTVVPSGETYQLVVEQRNCYNVNKIRQKNQAPLVSNEGEHTLAQSVNKKRAAAPTLELYPNPTSDYIQFSRDAERIIIRNLNGQTVYMADQVFAQQLIPVSSLTNGIYHFEATTAGGVTEVIRFVKL
ncbi:T9SS type A sorting domain-containing protein [Lewinella sp. LCG006]|uniref:T9SS type A sorting domain-containing protein n=1 Tax=Lewinella sp. LCG006 TaxID=3231911 RepID=UPI00346139B0